MKALGQAVLCVAVLACASTPSDSDRVRVHHAPIVTGAGVIADMVADDTYLFWCADGVLGRTEKADRSHVALATGTQCRKLHLTATDLYYTTPTSIGRLARDTHEITVLETGTEPTSLAVTSTSLYWSYEYCRLWTTRTSMTEAPVELTSPENNDGCAIGAIADTVFLLTTQHPFSNSPALQTLWRLQKGQWQAIEATVGGEGYLSDLIVIDTKLLVVVGGMSRFAPTDIGVFDASGLKLGTVELPGRLWHAITAHGRHVYATSGDVDAGLNLRRRPFDGPGRAEELLEYGLCSRATALVADQAHVYCAVEDGIYRIDLPFPWSAPTTAGMPRPN